MSPEPTLYYRHGCHLCEEMAAVLLRGWPDVARSLRWVDIDRDAQLAERYGRRVPVLALDGRILCELEPDLPSLTRSFGTPRLPI